MEYTRPRSEDAVIFEVSHRLASTMALKVLNDPAPRGRDDLDSLLLWTNCYT
jgi:hypothetical protein